MKKAYEKLFRILRIWVRPILTVNKIDQAKQALLEGDIEAANKALQEI